MSASHGQRVFIGLQEISGYYSGLESGLNDIGVAARFINIHPHPFGYAQTQDNPAFARQAVKAVLRHREANRLGRQYWAFWYLLNVTGLLFWSLSRFDAYIFAWGQTFLPVNLDLLLLRALRKRVIVNVGHGSEARPPYMSYLHEDIKAEELNRRTRDMSRRLRRLERWATYLIGLPTTAQLLRNDFINFYALGLPIEQNTHHSTLNSVDRKQRSSRETIRLLHVPSKPQVKGSAHIRVAVEKLRESRPEIEYLELTDVPHDEVMRALEDCDIVIDQLWSDIPMAVVGVEAALRAKPSVIGGYAWGFWDSILPLASMPPAVRFEPEELMATLEICVNDIHRMRQLGLEAYRFVSENWSTQNVARRFERLIIGEIPLEWLFVSEKVQYAYGGGLSKEKLFEQVLLLVENFGWNSLKWPAAFSVYSSSIEFPRRK